MAEVCIYVKMHWCMKLQKMREEKSWGKGVKKDISNCWYLLLKIRLFYSSQKDLTKDAFKWVSSFLKIGDLQEWSIEKLEMSRIW